MAGSLDNLLMHQLKAAASWYAPKETINRTVILFGIAQKQRDFLEKFTYKMFFSLFIKILKLF